MEIDCIYNLDCLLGMKEIPNGSIDCVITSPPYNVSLDYNEYNDNKEYSDYLFWMREVFSECFRILKSDGRMCVNVGDGKNGAIPTHSDFIQICKDLGFLCVTTIIWNKNTTSNRAAWGSFMSPSSPSFPRSYEYVLLFCKNRKLMRDGVSTISRENFIKWANGIWNIQPEKISLIGHPASFPIELPIRCIEMLTYKNDLVLDPFIGSGTTAIAAIKTNRHYLGFEIDPKYYEIALKRIKNENSQLKLW